MRSPVADLLADLVGAFATLGLPWYLFGAQPAIVYGAARLTADVDVTVVAPEHSVAAGWLQVLGEHGFDAQVDDRRFLEQTRVLPLVHRTTGLPTDVVLAGPVSKRTSSAAAVTCNLDGVAVPVDRGVGPGGVEGTGGASQGR